MMNESDARNRRKRQNIWASWSMLIVAFIVIVMLLVSCGGERSVAVGQEGETSAAVVGTEEPEGKMVETAVSTSWRASESGMAAVPATLTAVPTSRPAEGVMPSASPTAKQPLSFAVVGDYGTAGAGTQEVAALVESWQPDLVLTLGDNNYPDGAAETIAPHITQHYGRFIDEGRFFPVLGNHDMTTDFGQPYLNYFELPGNERYYDFVRGDVHFFALNSDWREVDGIGAGSRQAAWLQRQLEESTAVWQIVYFHAPPYVSMAGKQVEALRWPFAQWGADLVLSGHAHLYERLQVDGITYVVNGLGGGGIYPFDEDILPGSQARFNEDYGALLVEVDGNDLTLQLVTRAREVVDFEKISRGE